MVVSSITGSPVIQRPPILPPEIRYSHEVTLESGFMMV